VYSDDGYTVTINAVRYSQICSSRKQRRKVLDQRNKLLKRYEQRIHDLECSIRELEDRLKPIDLSSKDFTYASLAPESGEEFSSQTTFTDHFIDTRVYDITSHLNDLKIDRSVIGTELCDVRITDRPEVYFRYHEISRKITMLELDLAEMKLLRDKLFMLRRVEEYDSTHVDLNRESAINLDFSFPDCSNIEPESGSRAIPSIDIMSFGELTISDTMRKREQREKEILGRQQLAAQQLARQEALLTHKLQAAQIESAQKTLEVVSETTMEDDVDSTQISKMCDKLSTIPRVDKELPESQQEKQPAMEPDYRYWDPKLSYKNYLKSSNTIKLENTELCPFIMDDFDSFEQLLTVYGKNENFYDWVCYFDQFKFFTDNDLSWLSKNQKNFCSDNRAIRSFARVLLQQLNPRLPKPGDMIRYRLLYYLMSIVYDKHTFIPILYRGHVLPFVTLRREDSIVYEPVSFRYRMLSKLLPRDVTVEKWDDFVVKHGLYCEVRNDVDPEWLSQPSYLVVKMFFDRLPNK
jgi:hypothetical protein